MLVSGLTGFSGFSRPGMITLFQRNRLFVPFLYQTTSGVPAYRSGRPRPEKQTLPFFDKIYFTGKNNTPFIVTACYNLILKPAYVKFQKKPSKTLFFRFFFF